jgi:hypothetical protein
MDRKKLDDEEKSGDADQTDLGEPAKIFRNITTSTSHRCQWVRL